MSRLEHARERFSADWAELRQSMRKETGRSPRGSKALVWTVLALTVGLSLGASVRRRRKKRA